MSDSIIQWVCPTENQTSSFHRSFVSTSLTLFSLHSDLLPVPVNDMSSSQCIYGLSDSSLSSSLGRLLLLIKLWLFLLSSPLVCVYPAQAFAILLELTYGVRSYQQDTCEGAHVPFMTTLLPRPRLPSRAGMAVSSRAVLRFRDTLDGVLLTRFDYATAVFIHSSIS